MEFFNIEATSYLTVILPVAALLAVLFVVVRNKMFLEVADNQSNRQRKHELQSLAELQQTSLYSYHGRLSRLILLDVEELSNRVTSLHSTLSGLMEAPANKVKQTAAEKVITAIDELEMRRALDLLKQREAILEETRAAIEALENQYIQSA